MSDLRPLHSALKAIGNPTAKLKMLSHNINSLIMELKKKMEDMRVLVERVAEEVRQASILVSEAFRRGILVSEAFRRSILVYAALRRRCGCL